MPVRKLTPGEQQVREGYESALPEWLKPTAESSVFDPWYAAPVRKVARFFGADDPYQLSLNMTMAGFRPGLRKQVARIRGIQERAPRGEPMTMADWQAVEKADRFGGSGPVSGMTDRYEDAVRRGLVQPEDLQPPTLTPAQQRYLEALRGQSMGELYDRTPAMDAQSRSVRRAIVEDLAKKLDAITAHMRGNWEGTEKKITVGPPPKVIPE